MTQHNAPDSRSVIRWILLGLVLAASAVGANGQILPAPLPIPPAFTPPQDVSNGVVETYQMAVDSAGNVNLAWQNNFPGDVFFSRSSDGGQTFSAPMDLSNVPTCSGCFQIAMDSSGNIYVVWFDTNANVISNIRSSDGGASFSSPTTISTSPGPPSLTIDPSGNVVLCWANRVVPRSIFCSQSADGGASFSSPVKVADLNRGFNPPLIAVDGAGNINLAWTDDFLIPNGDFASDHKVFFSRSSDGGVTFSPPQDLSGFLNFPPTLSMALDASGNINVLWESMPHGNVFLSRSNDGGATFFRTQVTPYVSTGTSPTPEGPQMALDSCGNINVVWWDDSLGHFAILFSRSVDGGATFAAPKSLSDVTTDSRGARIVVDSGGNIDVVWEEKMPSSPSNSFISDIFFTRSSDGGGIFSAPQNISNNTGGSFESAIALDSAGNINVAWRDDTPGTIDLFYSRGSTGLGLLPNVCLPLPLPSLGTSLGKASQSVNAR